MARVTLKTPATARTAPGHGRLVGVDVADATQFPRSRTSTGVFVAEGQRPCGVAECPGLTSAQSEYCRLHRQRLARTGSLHLQPRKSFYERFWEKVEERGPDECWPWKAGRTGEYGQFMISDGHPMIASRVAFMIVNGYEPLVVRHTCDNPPCCNPRHLLPGTHQDNMNDMADRGRKARGERTGVTKLTEQDVRMMRQQYAAGATIYRVAVCFGVTWGHARDVVKHRRWVHIA